MLSISRRTFFSKSSAAGSAAKANSEIFRPLDTFPRRHNGPNAAEIGEMLKVCKVQSLEDAVNKAVPSSILLKRPLALTAGVGEQELLGRLKFIAQKNKVFSSYIGMGYHNCIVPAVIQRNILENPQWYTQVLTCALYYCSNQPSL